MCETGPILRCPFRNAASRGINVTSSASSSSSSSAAAAQQQQLSSSRSSTTDTIVGFFNTLKDGDKASCDRRKSLFYIRDAVDAGGEQGRSAQEDNHLSLRGEEEWRILVSYEPDFWEMGAQQIR